MVAVTAAETLLRAYESADLPALQKVREAAFAPIFRSFHALLGDEIAVVALAEADAEQAELLGSICKPGSGHQQLVATREGEIVGFVSFSIDAGKKIGEIGLNAVHPAHAGQGIGAMMYEQAIARMRAAGAAVATVGTGGDASHAAARRAYEKAGFGPAIPSLTLYRSL